MKLLIGIIPSLFLFISCNQKNSEIQNNVQTDWLENGSLHKATVGEWKIADENNKLATCADFVGLIKKNKNEKYISIEEIKIDAIDMKNCIDEAIKGEAFNDNIDIAEVAVGCDIVMDKVLNLK